MDSIRRSASQHHDKGSRSGAVSQFRKIDMWVGCPHQTRHWRLGTHPHYVPILRGSVTSFWLPQRGRLMGLSCLTREMHARVLILCHGIKVSMVCIWLQQICVRKHQCQGWHSKSWCVNFAFSQLQVCCRYAHDTTIVINFTSLAFCSRLIC